MNLSSFFIKDKALFGSFPTQTAVNELEAENVKFFIDLTHNTEKKITPYCTKYTYINYPITDRQVPDDLISFSKFIITTSKIIKELRKHEKVYIHCRGGQIWPQ